MADTTRGSDESFVERLYATEGNYNIRIGCCDGSGFFYCGTTDDLKERLGSVEEHLQGDYKRRYEEQEADFAQFLRRDISPNRYVKTYHGRTHRIPTYEEYEKNVRDWFDLMAKAKASLEKSKRKYLNRKPLTERLIVDFYKSFTEDDTWIMIITGDEEGEYWTADEYKKGVTNEDA